MIRQEKRRLDGPYEKQVTEGMDTERRRGETLSICTAADFYSVRATIFPRTISSS